MEFNAVTGQPVADHDTHECHYTSERDVLTGMPICDTPASVPVDRRDVLEGGLLAPADVARIIVVHYAAGSVGFYA